jgi:integrase
MILGCGAAQTDAAIIAEYHRFLNECGNDYVPIASRRYHRAPALMQQRLGKPPSQWNEDDILRLYAEPTRELRVPFCAFLAFLFFRGYHHPSFRLVVEYPGHFTRIHTKALQPYRQKLEQLCDELGYRRFGRQIAGSELNLLIALLLVSQKTVEAVCRSDFEEFEQRYQDWYRATQRQKNGKANSRIARLEKYLVRWGLIAPPAVTCRREERLAHLNDGPIRKALVLYQEWCTVRDAPSTVISRQNALLDFFVWFQEQHPDAQRLDQVTRSIALAYARHLKTLQEAGQRSINYCNDIYRFLRLFYEFVIQEQLDSSPDRNPFGLKDLPTELKRVQRYLSDTDVRKVLEYCENDASLKERTVVTLLLHTGIRASELAALKVSDIVEIQGKWKLHIHEGKGLKDRLVPLTPQCLTALQQWKEQGWEQHSERLFTRFGRVWHGYNVGSLIHDLGKKIGVSGLSPHRFRHTFAVALLNYGMRETALQKIMGHTTLNMTLEYARILDQTVERAFTAAIDQMRTGPLSWVPNFLSEEAYTIFVETDAISWIRLPIGYCRCNPKLHCESDVKCLLCERFAAFPADLPRLQEMHARFRQLGLSLKAEVVAAQIRRLEEPVAQEYIPLELVAAPAGRGGAVESQRLVG